MTPTTMEKAHGCNPVGFQNDATNDLNFPTGQREGKAFATLAARFALAGHALTRSNPADGAVVYFVGRWGMSQAMHDLDTVGRYLVQLEAGDASSKALRRADCPLSTRFRRLT